MPLKETRNPYLSQPSSSTIKHEKDPYKVQKIALRNKLAESLNYSIELEEKLNKTRKLLGKTRQKYRDLKTRYKWVDGELNIGFIRKAISAYIKKLI